MKSLLTIILTLLLSACAQFKSAPRLEKNTVHTCDAQSSLEQVRACVTQLKRNYVDAADTLATEHRGAGMFLLSMAGVGGGVELFDGSRRITQGAGLLGSLFAGKDRYIPRSTLIAALENGKSRLECALVKSAEFEEQAHQMAPLIAELFNDYAAIDKQLDAVISGAGNNALLQSKADQAEEALYEMKSVCEQTTFMRATQSPASGPFLSADKYATRLVTETDHARKLYAVGVSISDGVVSQFNGAVAPTGDIVAAIEKQLKAIKAATKEATAMTDAAAKLAEKVEETAAVANTAAGKPANGCDETANTQSTAQLAACKAKTSTEALKEKAAELKEKVEQLAITAKTLEACAGVVIGGGQ
jgi:hypothetical protein